MSIMSCFSLNAQVILLLLPVPISASDGAMSFAVAPEDALPRPHLTYHDMLVPVEEHHCHGVVELVHFSLHWVSGFGHSFCLVVGVHTHKVGHLRDVDEIYNRKVLYVVRNVRQCLVHLHAASRFHCGVGSVPPQGAGSGRPDAPDRISIAAKADNDDLCLLRQDCLVNSPTRIEVGKQVAHSVPGRLWGGFAASKEF